MRVTAAGSLPGDDFRGALAAMTEVLPEVLPLPELPARGVGSGMTGRALGIIDGLGFDNLDRRLLTIIIDHFDGGPVGLDTLAASIGEERGTLEDVVEPYLIQQGYLQRTPRGRVASARAYAHLGLEMPKP